MVATRLGPLALSALVVTACGSAAAPSAAGGQPSPSPAPVTSAPVTPAPISTVSASPDPLRPQPQGPEPFEPLPTASTATTTPDHRLVSLPWSYAGQQDSGRLVLLQIEDGGCTRFSGVQVRQAVDSVEIEVVGSSDRRPQVACPAIARIIRGSVRLQAPLGQRTLLHAQVRVTLPAG